MAPSKAHGHLKATIRDALLLRGSSGFDDLAAYRCFVGEVVSRRRRHNGRHIDLQQAASRALPARRTSEFKEVIGPVTSPSAFTQRRYSTPRPHG